MIVETRATVKRIAAMLCSMAALVCAGQAAGGAGSYLAGHGQLMAILYGLSGGAVFTWLAFRIWTSYLRDCEIIDWQEQEGGEPPP